MCIGILPACMYVCHVYAVPLEAKRGSTSSRTGVKMVVNSSQGTGTVEQLGQDPSDRHLHPGAWAVPQLTVHGSCQERAGLTRVLLFSG